MNQYDASELLRGVKAEKRHHFYESFLRTLWAWYPAGCCLFSIIVSSLIVVMLMYAVWMWISSPSLFGGY